MKHFYLNHPFAKGSTVMSDSAKRNSGKKPLPSRTDNQLREQLIHAGLLKPANRQESPCTKDRPLVKANN